MNYAKLLIPIFLLLCSCFPTNAERAAHLHYVKDVRTGLCYAIYTGSKGDLLGLANVSCKQVPKELFEN